MSRVLVVDDTPVDRCLIEGILKRDRTLEVQCVPDALTALRRIEGQPPDLVITDLQMPEIDGLDLVTILRERFPALPVVLITAHGSETLAVRAIDEGAASYVPKTQIASRLLPTIEQVLDASRTRRSYDEFQTCLQDARMRFVVGAQANAIEPLTDLARGLVGSIGLCDVHDQVRLAVALQGLLHLGYYAGNFEIPISRLDELDIVDSPLHSLIRQRREDARYQRRQLRVEIDVSATEGRFLVSHEGKEFDPGELACGTKDRELPSETYRGLVLLRAFADELILEDDRRTLVMIRGARIDTHV